MKSLRKRFHFAYIYKRKSATTEPAGRWNCVCYGFHNPFHSKMASADALMRTRFICACSRVKPTTETKNSASKVIRVTINSSLRRWATPERLIARAFFWAERFASAAWGRVGTFSRRQMLALANTGGTRILKITSPIQK